tara:strand:- start:363 stop:1073 length:711 start_codon:yes stop_codon:yes gene_type:complete
MSNRYRSPIWKIGHEDFKKLIKLSKSFSEALSFFSLENKGGNHETLKKRLKSDNVDFSHFYTHAHDQQIKSLKKGKIPLEIILVENSTYNRGHLKRRLIKEQLLEEKCYICKCGPIWNKKPLSLQLNHKNGQSKDNRLFNLELLCPNCHSQTKDFAGRKLKIVRNCLKCGNGISRQSQSGLCIRCSIVKNGKTRRKVINRPTLEVLKDQIANLGYCGTARIYGVSDNAIRKWVKVA